MINMPKWHVFNQTNCLETLHQGESEVGVKCFTKKIDQCALSLLWETMRNVHLTINIDSIGMYRYSSILSVPRLYYLFFP